MPRQTLLLAFLVYVVLDLSLPTMPGAFVFEVADSVESVQHHRGRAGAECVALPVVGNAPQVVSAPRLEVNTRWGQPRPPELPRHLVNWRRRPPGEAPPPSSEDPH